MCNVGKDVSESKSCGATTAAANGGKQHNALSCHHPHFFLLPKAFKCCVPMLRLSAPPD